MAIYFLNTVPHHHLSTHMKMKTIPMHWEREKKKTRATKWRRRRRIKCSNDNNDDYDDDKHVCSILLLDSITYLNYDRHILDDFLNVIKLQEQIIVKYLNYNGIDWTRNKSNWKLAKLKLVEWFEFFFFFFFGVAHYIRTQTKSTYTWT